MTKSKDDTENKDCKKIRKKKKKGGVPDTMTMAFTIATNRQVEHQQRMVLIMTVKYQPAQHDCTASCITQKLTAARS